MSKQVTPTQFDIWISDPVTVAYLDAMQYCLDKSKSHLADGKAVDPKNADVTLFNVGFMSGRRDTLTEALNPKQFLGDYERPEVANAG